MQLENGKRFVINAPANSELAKYVQTTQLNGKKYENNWIGHFDIEKGGSFNVTMGAAPNKERGTKESSYPYSFSSSEDADILKE